jgi:hypothetical protein
MDAINAPVLLLVEGRDEKEICEILLHKIDPLFAQKIDVQHADGGASLLASANTVDVLSGFSQLKTMAIVVDAEESPNKTNSTWTQFKNTFQKNYPICGCEILVLPSAEESGALETLFLKSLDTEKNSIARCAIDFVACVGELGAQSTQARKDKLALVSYINAHTKNPYSRVGVAIQQDASKLFDFDHPSFQPLTEFLKAVL